MVKVIGKIDVKKTPNKPMYMVKRKKIKDCLNVTVLRELGKSTLANCQKTCDILNQEKDNLLRTKKEVGKKFFYFPTLYTDKPYWT